MMKQFVILVACLASLVSSAEHNPAWTDFRGSFLIGQDNSFAPFPNTTSDSRIASEDWKQISTECTNGGLWNGFRYVRSTEDAVALLFDIQGTIAGLQLQIPKNVVSTDTNTLEYENLPAYQSITYQNNEYYVVTSYFVQPDTICTVGRSAADLADQGTGTGVWIQNGTSPDALVQIPDERPLSENEDLNDGWTKNNCFVGMGSHNFYSINEYNTTNCRRMFPVFGLYGPFSNSLLGFGLITVGNMNSTRVEHPPASAIKLILGEGKVPQCVLDIEAREKITSLHVYFTPKPWGILCPVSSIADYLRVFRSGVRSWLSGLVN